MKSITMNTNVLKFVDQSVSLCKPDKVVWIDGSKELYDSLLAEALKTGEFIKLNQELLPDCYLHRSAVNDVARVEGRTFICCEQKDDAGPTNNWMAPAEAYSKLEGIFDGCMKGRIPACPRLSIPRPCFPHMSPQFCLTAVQESSPAVHRLRC